MRGAVHMQITTIGLDIAKNVFQVHGIDATEKVIVRKQLRRGQLIKFFEALAPCEAEKQREAEARRREAERQREAEAQQREAEKQREAEARRREAERQREAEAREKMAGKPRQWWEVLGVSSQAPLEEIMPERVNDFETPGV